MQTPGSYTFLRLFLFSTALSLLSAASLTAQTTAARPDRGIMPGASYSVSDIENISLTNGNVQLTIPLASLPPIAGGKLKFTISAVYNSKLWNVTRQENRESQFYGCPSWVVDTPQLSDLGGWRIPLGYRLVFRNAHEDFDYVRPEAPPTPDCETDVQEQLRLQSQYYRVILIGPDGAEHELRPSDSYAPYAGTRPYLLNYYKDTPTTVGAAMRYYSFDGSYLYAVINPSSSSTSWTVYMNDGTRIVQYSNGIQRITDTNGNSIKIFWDANGGHVQDELTGREIRLYNDKVFYKTVTNVEQSIDIVMGSTHVQGKIYQVNDWIPTGGETGGGSYCTRNDILDTWVPVIREIIFPVTEPGVSARRYTFSYNSDTASANVTDDMRLGCNMPLQPYTRTVSNGMGELSQVVTPSGATVTYSYSKTSINNFSFDTNDIPRATVTQKQLIHDGVTDTWTYNIFEFGGCGGVVTAPDGSSTTEQCYPHDPAWARFFGYTDDRGGLTYRSRRSDKEIVERHWTMLPFSGANTNLTGSTGGTSFNPVVDVEYLTLLDDTSNHSPIKMSARKYQYDFNGNLTQQIDYDWFDPALVSRSVEGVPTGVPAGATVLRTTDYSHYNQAATAGSANVYAKRSLSTATPLILSAPRLTTLGLSVVKFGYDGQAFDVAPTAGNLTTKSVYDDLDDKSITTSSTYDVYGNVLTATDGRGKVTQYFYDDTTHALPNRVVVDPQNGTGTQTTTTVYDYATGLVTSVTDPNSATSTISYTNQLLNAVDPFGRPGVTTGPLVNVGGTNQHHRVTTTYEDHSLRVIVASDLNSEDDKLLKTRTTTDMLGRTVLVEQTEDGTNYTLYSQQAYAQAGRITLSSSVMRSGSSSSTDSWTRVTNDVLGRVSEVITFGGATQPPSTGTTAAATGTVATAYNANFTTVTDQAGKVRRSVVDAIGRLIRVDEPDASNNLGTTTAPVQPTSYAYDVFGNLTTVTQGAQTRTFTYDSLSRLRTAVNPESGSIAYQYDDNGNLLVKTDARGVSAHFEYDSLNRIKRRWYNGSNLISGTTHNIPALPAGVGATDEVKFYYDSQVLPTGAPSYTRGATVGRLVAQTYGTSIDGDYYAYDALGRATLKYQQTGSIAYPISASYNLSGALTTLTYPSGHSVTNSYDQAGRLSAFSGNLGDNITRTYATGILYSPTGGLVKEQFGTAPAIYTKRLYNSRGQLFDTRVSSVNDTWDWNRGRLILYYSSNHIWGQSGTDNNGNVRSAEVWIPPQNATLDQADTLIEDSYTYDALNRLTSVSEQRTSVAGGWGNWQQQFRQQYTYDRYGNRTIDAAQTWGTGINNKQFTVNTATNRLAVPAGQSGVMSYDAAGNLTNDTYTGAGNRTYDAENKITSAWGGNNQAQLYGYDASGQRIKRTVDGVTTWQVYGFGGELLAEYAANGTTGSPQKEYGYRNGQLLITASPANSGSGSGGCNSLAVNGSTAYVEAPNSSNLNIAGALTMEAWIKLPAVSTTYQPIIDKSPSVGNEGGYDLFVTDTGKARMDIFYSPSYQWLIGNTTLTAGVWHHIAGVYDGSQLRLYVDGQLDGSVNLASAMTGSSVQLRIGKNNYLYGPLYFNGLIDEVRISTGALYSSNFTPPGTLTASSSTKGLWKFDGQTTSDSSANSNNGSLNGGATYSNDVPAAGGGGSAENVTWTNAVGVSSNGNSLTATANGWTAGASSTRAIMSGDGYVQFTASETSSYRMMALSHGDANQSYEELDFAFYLGQNGYLYVYENNVPVYFAGFYATGDTLRIAVESGVVKYRRNGAVVYTSTATPTYPLLADASLSTAGSTINNVVLSGNLGSSASTVQWLVADHLGTPRMILDEWGNLAAMKRHDYLPFGEELLAPTGGRSAAQGYASGDGIRQQFTQKEREVETGLDYFEARYYSPIQGRFTSSDPGKFVPADPQSWNRYSYTQSNPLKYVDLTGKDLYISGDYAEELVKELEKKSGYKLNYDKKSGKVTIDKDVKRQTKGTSKTLASALNLAVTSEHQIPIITVSESKDHVEIIVDSFASRQVDIDDYRAANRDAPDVATGFLTHILTEYTTAAKYPVPYSNEFRFVVSQQIALQEEFKAISDMTRTLTRQGSDTFIGHVAAPPMTIHTDYYSIQYDMIMKSGANGRASQIDKVITTKREPKKK